MDGVDGYDEEPEEQEEVLVESVYAEEVEGEEEYAE